MIRECRALVTPIALVALSPACSLVLDFDEALPSDAAIDGPSSKAECDFLEPNNTFFEAKSVTAADSGPAAICAPATPGGTEDRDFYKFTASGATTTISVTFTDRPGGDLDLKLYDSSGTMVASSREFGGTETLVCPGASPACPQLMGGDYTFEVFPGVVGSANTYTFSVAQ